MKYILTHPQLFPSCRVLRNILQNKTGKRIVLSRNYQPGINNRMILSYGNSNYPVYLKTVNTPGFIDTVSHKLRLSTALSSAGVNTVVFKRGLPATEDYPVYVRTMLQGMKGRGIIVCKTEEEFLAYGGSRFYWSKGLDIKDEYRVHVGITDNSAQLLRVFKKIPLTEGHTPVKNSTNCHFSLRFLENRFNKLRSFLEPLTSIPEFIPGSFFSLDVGLQTSGEYVVFEGNTASGLNESTAEVYANFLLPYISM